MGQRSNPPVPPVEGGYVYFKNNNGWDSVNAYYWSYGNTTMTTWPGVPMESVGNNVYRVEVPAGATKIIFNGNGAQTDDIDLAGANKLYDNNQWYDYTG